MDDLISRQAAIDAAALSAAEWDGMYVQDINGRIRKALEKLPSAQPERRYTEEELKVFQHGISLGLLSKRSSQHWCYDEDTATEIEFLEQLYEKVSADMRGETE